MSFTVEIFFWQSRFFLDSREFFLTVEIFSWQSRIIFLTVEIFFWQSRFFFDSRELFFWQSRFFLTVENFFWQSRIFFLTVENFYSNFYSVPALFWNKKSRIFTRIFTRFQLYFEKRIVNFNYLYVARFVGFAFCNLVRMPLTKLRSLSWIFGQFMRYYVLKKSY